MDFDITIFRLIITFLLALAFGLERQRSHKPVGFGTFIFVAIGSCGLALAALSLSPEDPTGLLSAIVTGIGFLGAGALIKNSDKIFGFTTAASIWLFAIFGLTIGTGHYEIGISLYIFIWICVIIDKNLESSGIVSYQKKIRFKINNLDKDADIMQLFKKFRIKKHKLISKSVNKTEKFVSLFYLLQGSGKNIRALIKKMEKIPYITEISFE